MGPLKLLAWVLALTLVATPAGAARRPHTQDVRACTFNTWRLLPAPTFRAEVRRLAPSCDLLALQETGARSAWGITPPGWALSRPRRCLGQPIAYRPGTWTRTAAGAVLGDSGRGLFPGATRWLCWARFRAVATGAVVNVVNVHAIPHVEAGGHPRHLPRLALYRAWLAALGRLVAAQRGRVLVLGDFNVDARADCRVRTYAFPCAWSDRVHLVNVWRVLGMGRGTRGTRTIDYTMDRGPRIWPLSRHVLMGYPSDHRPVVARYRLSH